MRTLTCICVVSVKKSCEERAGEEVGCEGMRTLTCICIVSKLDTIFTDSPDSLLWLPTLLHLILLLFY